jgi:hypothetical protein
MGSLQKRIDELEKRISPDDRPYISYVTHEGDSEGEKDLKKQVALIEYNARHESSFEQNECGFIEFHIVYDRRNQSELASTAH